MISPGWTRLDSTKLGLAGRGLARRNNTRQGLCFSAAERGRVGRD